jgi:O-antigen ligase
MPAGFAAFLAGIFLPHAIGSILLALFLVLVAGAANWKTDIKSFLKTRFFVIQACLWLLYLISILWSDDKMKGLEEAFSKIPFLLVPLILAGKEQIIAAKASAWTGILWLASILINLACLTNVFLHAENENLSSLLVYEGLAAFSGLQPIYLSLFCILGAIGWYNYAASKAFKPAVILLIPAFLYLMVMMLSSRMESIVFIGLILVVMWIRMPRHSIITQGIIPGLALLGISFLVVTVNPTNRTRFKESVDFNTHYSEKTYGGTQLRIEKWKNTIKAWKKEPLLGSGAGDYMRDLQESYRQNNFDIGIKESYNSHNQYLQILLTLGITGLLLWIGIFVEMFIEFRRSGHLPLLLCMLAVSLSVVTESMLERRVGLFLCLVLCNLFYLLSKAERTKIPVIEN